MNKTIKELYNYHFKRGLIKLGDYVYPLTITLETEQFCNAHKEKL